MAQIETAKAKDKFGGNQFPIHYEGHDVRVYTNPTGEIFVEDTRTGISMRINPSHSGGLRFSTSGRVEPIAITGEWHVGLR